MSPSTPSFLLITCMMSRRKSKFQTTCLIYLSGGITSRKILRHRSFEAIRGASPSREIGQGSDHWLRQASDMGSTVYHFLRYQNAPQRLMRRQLPSNEDRVTFCAGLKRSSKSFMDISLQQANVFGRGNQVCVCMSYLGRGNHKSYHGIGFLHLVFATRG